MTSDNEPAERPWQFSLRWLFGLTTACAGATALALYFGIGSLMASAVVLLCGLIASGSLSRLRSDWIQPKLVYTAWGLFLVSLFLPSAEGCNGKKLAGWECAWTLVSEQAESAVSLASGLDEWRKLRERPVSFVFAHSLDGLISVNNLVMLSLPFWLGRWRRERSRWTSGIVTWGALVASFCAVPSFEGMLVGYFVWWASICLVMAARPISWRTTLGLAVLDIAVLVGSKWV